METDTSTIREKKYEFLKFSMSMTMISTEGWGCEEHLNNIFHNVTLICMMVKVTDSKSVTLTFRSNSGAEDGTA